MLRIGTSYQIPAVLVNRESHAAVQAWLQETKFRLWRVKYKKRKAANDPANWTFERFFDRHFDIVYVAPEKWTLFIEEERDETERRHSFDVEPWPSGYNLPTAINLSTLLSKTYELKKLVGGWWHRISELYVILDGDSDGLLDSFDDAFDECWELETVPGGHFSYDILLERYDWKSDGSEAETRVARFIGQNLHSMNAGLASRFQTLRDKIRGTYVTPPHDESNSAFDSSNSDSDDVPRRPGVDTDLAARCHAANPYNIWLVKAVRRR